MYLPLIPPSAVSMHYERAASLSSRGLLGGRRKLEKATQEWHCSLRERLRWTRCSFPQGGNSNESRRQIYRNGRAQGSDRDRRAERQWQAGDGVDRGNQNQQHSAVHPRSARRVTCDLGRRNLGGLALRPAATPGAASAGLRSAAQCLIKGRQQERQDRRAQAGRLVTHGNGATGLD